MLITSIASQKGGTGKTTTTLALATGLARKGKKVLVVDMDSQANSSKILLRDYQQIITRDDTICTVILDKSQDLSVHKSDFENVDVVPSHILLSEADVTLTTAMDHREARLAHALKKIQGVYDYIFIDCPPSLSWLTLNALNASDQVITVISPGYFELDSVKQISKTIGAVRENFGHPVVWKGILFNMSEPTNNSKVSLQVLRQTFDNVFKTVIPRNTAMKDAHANKESIYDFNPSSSSAQAYDKLIAEIYG